MASFPWPGAASVGGSGGSAAGSALRAGAGHSTGAGHGMGVHGYGASLAGMAGVCGPPPGEFNMGYEAYGGYGGPALGQMCGYPGVGVPQPQEGPQQDIEYQKMVAKDLIDALDETSLWHLANILQQKGLLNLPSAPPMPTGTGVGMQFPQATQAMYQDPKKAFAPFAGAPRPTAASPLTPAMQAVALKLHTALPTKVPPTTGSPNTPSNSAPVQPAPQPWPLVLPVQGPGRAHEINLASALAEVDTVAPPQPFNASTRVTSSTAGGNPQTNAGPDSRGEGATTNGGGQEDPTATSLILRNLPPSFDQASTQDWVDTRGFQGTYDFLLWFPAKKTSRLSTASYAFVNFRQPQDALRFRQEFHLHRFPTTEPDVKQQFTLSIAVAKVQGFAENYVRFHHLVEDKSPTLCKPFFAQDAIAQLSKEHIEAAASSAAAGHAPDNSTLDGQQTTLIIRNLPLSLACQDAAKQWLDTAGPGFADQYDFFLFLPAKRRRADEVASAGSAGSGGLGYAFVNFKTVNQAQVCLETLNGRSLGPEDPRLNVIASRVQGVEECLKHFNTLAESGRIVPWVAPRQFQ